MHSGNCKQACIPFVCIILIEDMEREVLIERLKGLARATMPAGSSLLLYGSRARGDAREDSDWDLLILLDKPRLEADDYGVAYPFRELG